MTWRIRSRQADGESGGASSAEGADSEGAEPDLLRRLLFLSGTKTSFHIHIIPGEFRKTDGDQSHILMKIILSQRLFGS